MVCKIGSFLCVFFKFHLCIHSTSVEDRHSIEISEFILNKSKDRLFNNYKQNNYNKGANGFKRYYICKTNYMYIVITSGLHPQYSLYFNHFVQINPCI